MPRARTARRQRARIEAKQVGEYRRELGARGLLERIAKVNAAVAPDAAFFWHAVKQRIAAREAFGPLRDVEVVRSIAMAVLRQEGHDLTGLVLKVNWQPPVLRFVAAPLHEIATDVVTAVDASERGARHRRALAQLSGR